MQINFQGQYDQNLFFKAVALANQPPKNRNRLLSFLLVIAIGAFGVIIYRMVTTGDWVGNVVYLVGALIMGGYVAYVLISPYFIARKLWQNPGVQRPLKGIINEHGITYQLPEGDNLIPWSRFRRVRKTSNLTTLVRDDGLLVIFVAQFFKSARYWEQFNKLVDQKIAPIDRSVQK